MTDVSITFYNSKIEESGRKVENPFYFQAQQKQITLTEISSMNEKILERIYEDKSLEVTQNTKKISKKDDAVKRLAQNLTHLPVNFSPSQRSKSRPKSEKYKTTELPSPIEQPDIPMADPAASLPRPVSKPQTPIIDCMKQVEQTLRKPREPEPKNDDKLSVVEEDEVLKQLFIDIQKKKSGEQIKVERTKMKEELREAQISQQTKAAKHPEPEAKPSPKLNQEDINQATLQRMKEVVLQQSDLELSKQPKAEQTKTKKKNFVSQKERDEALIEKILRQKQRESSVVMPQKQKTTQKVPKVQQNVVHSKIKEQYPVVNGDYVYEFLETLISDEKIIAITKISTGQRVYRRVPRLQYDELAKCQQMTLLEKK